MEQVHPARQTYAQHEAIRIKNEALTAYNEELTARQERLHSELAERQQLELRLKKYSNLVGSINTTLTMFLASEYAPQQMWDKMLEILLSVSESQFGFIKTLSPTTTASPISRHLLSLMLP